MQIHDFISMEIQNLHFFFLFAHFEIGDSFRASLSSNYFVLMPEWAYVFDSIAFSFGNIPYASTSPISKCKIRSEWRQNGGK